MSTKQPNTTETNIRRSSSNSRRRNTTISSLFTQTISNNDKICNGNRKPTSSRVKLLGKKPATKKNNKKQIVLGNTECSSSVEDTIKTISTNGYGVFRCCRRSVFFFLNNRSPPYRRHCVHSSLVHRLRSVRNSYSHHCRYFRRSSLSSSLCKSSSNRSNGCCRRGLAAVFTENHFEHYPLSLPAVAAA